jgi:hypothetical protein
MNVDFANYHLSSVLHPISSNQANSPIPHLVYRLMRPNQRLPTSLATPHIRKPHIRRISSRVHNHMSVIIRITPIMAQSKWRTRATIIRASPTTERITITLRERIGLRVRLLQFHE